VEGVPPPERSDLVVVRRDLAVFSGVGTVLTGAYAVGLGLHAVQRRLGAQFSGGVTTGGCPLAGVDQIGAVTSTEVAITRGEVPIDLGVSPIEGGVVRRDGARLVALVRCDVTSPGRDVTEVRGDVPSDGPVQDLANAVVPLDAVTVSFVGDGVPLIGGAVPPVGRGVTLVRQPVTLVSRPFPIAQPPLALIHYASPRSLGHEPTSHMVADGQRGASPGRAPTSLNAHAPE